MFQFDSIENGAEIKVIGVGGGGGNAVKRMMQSELNGVDYIVANTDAQALAKHPAKNKIQLGDKSARGLGAGGEPEKGKRAAEEDKDRIKEALDGADLVFLTCGEGGGTGTGAAPIVAQVSKEANALTIGVVTKPFAFEGKRRMNAAEKGISELRKYVDALIVIPNDRLLDMAGQDTPLEQAFSLADNILTQGVTGISDLITKTGLINLDFADVRSIMSNAGTALMGSGIASGQDRAKEAALAAISSPLLETKINGAKGLLVNISGGKDMTLHEVNTAMKIIQETTDESCNIIFGTVNDDRSSDEIRITVIATGFGDNIAIKDHKAASQVSHPIYQQEPIPREVMTAPIAPEEPDSGNINIPAFLRKNRG